MENLRAQFNDLVEKLPSDVHGINHAKQLIEGWFAQYEAEPNNKKLLGYIQKKLNYLRNMIPENPIDDAGETITDDAVVEQEITNPTQFYGNTVNELAEYIQNNKDINVSVVSSTSKAKKIIRDVSDLKRLLAIEPLIVITTLPGTSEFPYIANIQTFSLTNNMLSHTMTQVKKRRDQLNQLDKASIVAMARLVARKAIKNKALPVSRASELRMLDKLDVYKLKHHL